MRVRLAPTLALVSIPVLLAAYGASLVSIPAGPDPHTPVLAGSSQTEETVLKNAPGDPVLTWQGNQDGECHTLSLDPQGQASFGLCSGTRSTVPILPEMERFQDLSYFLQRYQPFETDTPAGRLTFAGYGAQVSTPAEARAVAEWASVVYRESEFGRSAASLGLALALIQEGARSCSRIQIEVFGKVSSNNCRGNTESLPTAWLDFERLERLYTWIDTFRAFEMQWSEDDLQLSLVFTGQGNRDASEAVQGEILRWVTGFSLSSRLCCSGTRAI